MNMNIYINSIKWNSIELKQNGKISQVPKKNYRSDIILYNNSYNYWNWTNDKTFVITNKKYYYKDTDIKKLLKDKEYLKKNNNKVHFPGLPLSTLYNIIDKCIDKLGTCDRVIISKGLENQLPIINSKFKNSIIKKYPFIKKKNIHFIRSANYKNKSPINNAMKIWNNAMKNNEKTVLLLHTTC